MIGIYDKMPEKEYFAADAISKSLLSRMDCPAKLNQPFKETPSMFTGSMAHKAILEPNDFDKCYIVAPAINKRTKAGKEEWAEFEAANASKLVITSEQYDMAMAMQKAIKSHPMASKLLKDGVAEQSHFWKDENTSELCKCRADYVRNDGVIVDLKTTVNASPSEFARTCAKFKYHWQDAWYSRGTKATDFYFIVVETSAPHVVECYKLSPEAKQKGLHEIDEALNKYISCKVFDEFCGYNPSNEVTTIDLPAWA